MSSIHSVESHPIFEDEYDLLPAIGEYHVASLEPNCPVAISTLASIELADQIFTLKPRGLSIVGKTETENIGIEKIIKNVLAVPSIRFLILCGKESEGHSSGNTMQCLADHGVDQKMRVIGSKGKKPILSNTTREEISAFRNQIEVFDLIDCEEIDKILEKVAELADRDLTCRIGGEHSPLEDQKHAAPAIEIVKAGEKDPNQVKLDPAGYFVIVPKAEKQVILVEHYSNTNQLLHVMKGKDARNLYWSILEKGWVSEMSHAAYLGKELARAELSLSLGFKYIQDKA